MKIQEEAEALAAQACYLVRDTACALWECLPHRSKDYVAAPKPNGYQSLHSTVRVRSETVSVSLGESSPPGAGVGGAAAEEGAASEEVRDTATLELQIRTQGEPSEGGMGGRQTGSWGCRQCSSRGFIEHPTWEPALDAAYAWHVAHAGAKLLCILAPPHPNALSPRLCCSHARTCRTR